MKLLLFAITVVLSFSLLTKAQSTASTQSSSVTPVSSATAAPTPTASPDATPVATPAVSPEATTAPVLTKSPVTSGPANLSKAALSLPPEKANPVTVPKNAAVFKDFYQTDPGDNTAPSKPTEVRVGYDPKFLYIAFRAFDEPDKVRSTVAKRDNIFQDDFVGFFLDTFNDKRKAFEVFFNPMGIQGDGVITEGRGEDFSVIDDKGYVVEVAIPFKSLRYEAGKGKLWGVHFLRRIQRFDRELNSWMPLRRGVSSTHCRLQHA